MSKKFKLDMKAYKIVRKIKEQLKVLGKKVKKANKPKTITLSSKTVNKIKTYCDMFNYNIGDWTEKILFLL